MNNLPGSIRLDKANNSKKFSGFSYNPNESHPFRLNLMSLLNKVNKTLIGIITLSLFPYLIVKVLKLDVLGDVLTWHWQILDLPKLFQEPVQSLIYLHAQPPLLNSLLVLFNLSHGDLYQKFIIFNSICVGFIATIIFKVVKHFAGTNRIAAIISLVYTIFPSTLLNITYPFYPCVTALCYSVLVYGFLIVDKNPKKSLLLFSISVVCLNMLRSSFSLFHLLFFCVVYCLLTRQSIQSLSKKNYVFMILIILCSIVPTKNYVLYGFFGSSSWAPMNLAGGLGIPARNGYFIPPKVIHEIYPNLSCAHSYHIQDSTFYKSSGQANYNSCMVLEYANIIKKDSLRGYDIRKHATKIIYNTWEYFSPSDKFPILRNRDKIAVYADVINWLQIKMTSRDKTQEIRILLLSLLLITLVFGWVKRNKFLLVCTLIVVSHYLTHALTDGYEGKRFVFDIEFIFFIFLGVSIWEIIHPGLKAFYSCLKTFCERAKGNFNVQVQAVRNLKNRLRKRRGASAGSKDAYLFK